MLANAAVLTPRPLPFEFSDVSSDTSNEISLLLLKAITCVQLDEAVAIDLVKKASTLLHPIGIVDGERDKERVATGGLAPWQVKRLHRFIEEHIAQPISLDDLAQLVKLSVSYFSTAFKASFGTSPHNYIILRRVEFAKQRMLLSDAPLCEIALDCGLADQAHLSRIFRRVTGTTPSAWRRYSSRSVAEQRISA